MQRDPSNPDRRVRDRVTLNRKVQLRFDKFQDFLTELAGDISPGGMFVRSDEPHQPGEQFEFECSLADGFPLVTGRAEVVWVRGQSTSAQHPAGMGVRFVVLLDKSEVLIRRIVQERLEAGEGTFELGTHDSAGASAAGAEDVGISEEILAASESIVEQEPAPEAILPHAEQDMAEADLELLELFSDQPEEVESAGTTPVEAIEPFDEMDWVDRESPPSPLEPDAKSLSSSPAFRAGEAVAEEKRSEAPTAPVSAPGGAETAPDSESSASTPSFETEAPMPSVPSQTTKGSVSAEVPAASNSVAVSSPVSAGVATPEPSSEVAQELDRPASDSKGRGIPPVSVPDSLRETSSAAQGSASTRPDPRAGVARAPRKRLGFLRFLELLLLSLLAGACMVLLFHQYWVRPRILDLEAKLEELTGSSQIGGPPGFRRAAEKAKGQSQEGEEGGSDVNLDRASGGRGTGAGRCGTAARACRAGRAEVGTGLGWAAGR